MHSDLNAVTVPCQTKHSPCSNDTDLLEPHTQLLRQLPRMIKKNFFVIHVQYKKETFFSRCKNLNIRSIRKWTQRSMTILTMWSGGSGSGISFNWTILSSVTERMWIAFFFESAMQTCKYSTDEYNYNTAFIIWKRYYEDRSTLRPPLHGPDKFLHRQKLAWFHLVFTWDHQNWTNIWTVKCKSLGSEKSRFQTCTLSRSNICPVPPVPCKHRAEPCKFLSVQKFVRTRVNRALMSLFR